MSSSATAIAQPCQEKPSASLAGFNRIIFLDCHTGEYPGYQCFADWDAAQIVGEAKKAGGDAFVFFAKDHFGNCFCDLPGGHKHRDVKGDFTGEIVAECRRQGIAPIVYYSVWADHLEGERHPEWQPVNEDYAKRVQKILPWRTLCVNSPFLDEVFIPHVEYIARNYDCAGIYLDTMNITSLCTCDNCRSAWAKEYGSPLDPEALKKQPRPWDAFFQLCWDRAMAKAHAAADKIRPGMEFFFFMRRTDPDEAKKAEHICGLDNYEVNLTYHFDRAGIFAHGLQSRYCRTQKRPATLLINAFYNCWGEATVKHPNLLATEIAAIRANGVKVSLAEYLRSWGKVEPRAFSAMAEAFNREEPLARFSGDGWRARPQLALLDGGKLCLSEYTIGAHRILAESHQQFDIVDESALDNLSAYQALWAPPVELWRPERWATVLDWVRAGGVLLAEMGPHLEDGQPGAELLHAAGVTEARRTPFSAAYLLPEGKFQDPVCGDLPLLLHESAWSFAGEGFRRLVDACDPIAEWNPPAIQFRTNVLHPRPDSRRAGIISCACGRGRIILLPGSVSRAYQNHNYAPLRRLLSNLLSSVCPQPYAVHGPCTLEANLLENADSGTRALHLVKYCLNVAGGDDLNSDDTAHRNLWCNARFSDIEDITPVLDVEVDVDGKLAPGGIRLHPGNRELPVERRHGRVYCVVPRIDLHAVLELY